ncbi:MAG: cytidine deaminase [Pseudomonadota bacterium]
MTDDELLSAAKTAREQAYCRYSNFAVGAALVDEHGNVHVGCNVENASYPLGNCAEAAAIAAMVVEGGSRIDKIAVVGGSGDITPCTPCGGCRQRIAEFANTETIIITMDDSNEFRHYSIDELLPASFHLD